MSYNWLLSNGELDFLDDGYSAYYIDDQALRVWYEQPVEYFPWSVDDKLFLHEPCLDDIHQSSIGNCTLLSALQGIVVREPHYIQTMLRVEKNFVYVKFYLRSKEQVVRIQKTKLSPELMQHKALWVHMIEKAFIAAYPRFGYTPEASKKSQCIFQTLFIHVPMPGYLSILSEKFSPDVRVVSEQYKNLYELFWRKLYNEDAYQDFLKFCQHFFANTPSMLEDFISKYEILSKKVIKKFGIINRNYYQVLRLESFRHIIETSELTSQTKQYILEYAERYLPNKRGSTFFQGRYVQNQLHYAEILRDALSLKKIICIGTDEDSVGRYKSLGGLGGYITDEDRNHGLVRKHAYTVIALYQRAERIFLLIRNPHGHYERLYKEKAKPIYGHQEPIKVMNAHHFDLKQVKQKEQFIFSETLIQNPEVLFPSVSLEETVARLDHFRRVVSGVFELELSDFTKRFTSMCIGGIS